VQVRARPASAPQKTAVATKAPAKKAAKRPPRRAAPAPSTPVAAAKRRPARKPAATPKASPPPEHPEATDVTESAPPAP
jgi:hypothetical protein